MGSWFTDYVFYPLSICSSMQKLTKWSRAHLGKAVGMRFPVYLATLFTWFLTGLWHGASWNFIVWGLLNGVIILVSRELEPLYAKFRKACPKLTASAVYGGFACVRTFFLMGAVRILDCYRDVPVTFKAFASIFYDFSHWSDLADGSFADKLGLALPVWILVGLATILIFFVSRASLDGSSVADRLSERPVLWTLAALGLTVAVLIFGSYGIGFDAGAFIYQTF
jgi:D-alanyl-lipoteichoic acid acyltransferase DltB (MBOAT superfamily)